MTKLKISLLFILTLLFIYINLINSTETNSDNNEGRLKRFGGWGGGTYRYGPCGYGGCNGYGSGGGWMNMGAGYGIRPVGWRPWRTGGGGRHSHESHSKESYG
nr:unnamed protein product [Meloidogyne enterolobii]